MDARQIQDLRAMLAAQAAAEAPPPTLARKLSRLWSSKPAPGPLGLSAAAETPASVAEHEDPLWLVERAIYPSEPVAAEILLGDVCPRRQTFGQRIEGAATEQEPPASPPRRLLWAVGGDPVGEMLPALQDAAAPHTKRPFESPHPETPFFPEDLADDPAPRPLRRLTLAPQPTAAPAAPALAAVFLLAALATRLASEEAALRQKLTGLSRMTG